MHKALLIMMVAMVAFGGLVPGSVRATPARPPAGTPAGTDDVFFGPTADPSSPAQWQAWHQDLLAFRTQTLREIGMPSGRYPDPHSAWSDGAFRQYHLFMYDQAFLRDGQYRTGAWLDEVERRLGKQDAVLLWQAYPQLGIDSRNQFDFYRGMPGGLAGLKHEVSDVLHARGVRVVIDFNPWDDHPDYDELASVVAALDADAIMLDTMDTVPPEMRAALDRRKPGIVLSPERHPSDAQLVEARASWAQWYDLGDRAAIYREKWLLPQHQQLAIRRWDTDRRGDIVFSFFNGSGMLLWDNIFGSWNPYSSADRQLLAETAVVLHAYRDLFVEGTWLPLLPSGAAGLDVNRWDTPTGSILTFRNRTDHAIQAIVPPEGMRSALSGRSWVALWGDRPTVPAHGAQALVLDDPAHAQDVRAELKRAGALAEMPEPDYEQITPSPRQLGLATPAHRGAAEGFAAIPGGDFEMRIAHARRESGCYPWGIDLGAMWGWYFQDLLTHRIPSHVEPFAIQVTAVTNAQYLEFVRASHYVPKDSARFVPQIPRLPDGAWPTRLAPELAALPVTYVSLEDARAYAAWAGARLPTEAEWQWAAEGAGAGNPWPWGKDLENRYNRSGRPVAADAFPEGATPQGVRGLTGNIWEWTDSEWSDTHNRFAMLRGGTYLAPREGLSEWMLPRGPHQNGYHAKYLLVSPGLDRSEAISFRVVR